MTTQRVADLIHADTEACAAGPDAQPVPVQQAIEALERYATDDGEQEDVWKALAALRSLPGLATEEEIKRGYEPWRTTFKDWVLIFRAGEQFTRRKILGEG